MAEPRFLVGLTMAAKLAGRDRSTILRAIQSGRMSERRDSHNRRRVDVAELERVYGPLRTVAPTSASASAEVVQAAPEAVRASEAEIERLRADLERERARADRYEAMAAEWQDSYRKLAERALLTDQRPATAAAPKQRRYRKADPEPSNTPPTLTDLAAGVLSALVGQRKP